MPRRKRPDPKVEALREERTLNPRPESISDELFQENDFFDARDLVQVKYEMLRRASAEGRSVSGASAAFGFSRPSFYKVKATFEEKGLPGLLPKRPGPKRAHKLTGEVMDFIERALAADESLRARRLAALVAERFGVTIHHRSIERALARRKRGRR